LEWWRLALLAGTALVLLALAGPLLRGLTRAARLLAYLLRRDQWVRQRRARLHLCVACGYDLRASATRCPECGEPIPRTGTLFLGSVSQMGRLLPVPLEPTAPQAELQTGQ